MADENNTLDAELFEEGEERDVLFIARMGIYDLFMKNWRYLVVAAGIVLVIALINGILESRTRAQQRNTHQQIAAVLSEVPAPDPRSNYGLAPADNPNDSARIAGLKEAAAELENIAKSASGLGEAMALQQAASLWKRAGERSQEQRVLKSASELKLSALVRDGIKLQLANSLFDSTEYEQAAALYSELATAEESSQYAKQRAQLSLVLSLEAQGKVEEARSELNQLIDSQAQSKGNSALSAEALIFKDYNIDVISSIQKRLGNQ